jgi:CheY-like chemotaxis protein
VVDDEPVAAGLLEDVLSPLGHRLTVFTDPDIALAWFNDHAAEIDLALLDMLMPSCSGLDLLRRLRQRRPDLRAAFISGYSPGEHAAAALAEGAVAVLMKPYSQQQLLSILANDSRSAAGT